MSSSYFVGMIGRPLDAHRLVKVVSSTSKTKKTMGYHKTIGNREYFKLSWRKILLKLRRACTPLLYLQHEKQHKFSKVLVTPFFWPPLSLPPMWRQKWKKVKTFQLNVDKNWVFVPFLDRFPLTRILKHDSFWSLFWTNEGGDPSFSRIWRNMLKSYPLEKVINVSTKIHLPCSEPP